ncbi:hypothetical protein [Pseudoalteromonas ruthenica]|uniref:Uncharacterized protein n=1 Tax=Pseudoalteromonas ruthenica TaxID=151081 RepID=A0A0F4PN28_9GAMM|nr:hypothetical protein [Pseudoalteromonas ruthenica]KJY93928.1 hypothetical protein TW76_18570 [Pseudoalteromonas ruthenica]KJY96418.1 hypothetical protein TW72_16900 [Pseudoalteromonas ruthenica]TMO94595.1 hypothetical protein CWC13_00055 [Pseudoalteromonas ruthenica]TMO97246.1 hypothetical protein CWC07_14775 [Pseudoalteromonas ruthenica]TMP09200.1 hypothetical protein CWC09_07725 [Pseudoalteromonas ruthenica]
MKVVTASNKEELKEAINSDATEIIIDDASLAKKLKAIKVIKQAGPLAVGAILVAIPLIPVTGGASVPTAAFFSSAGTSVAATTIAGLVIAIGGTVVISLFTDWEQVELNGVFKLKRTPKQPT